MNFEDIRDSIAEFPIVPKASMNAWILEALQDLCEETWVYREVLTFLTTAGTVEYTLSPSDSATNVVGIVKDGVEATVVDTPNVAASDGTATGTLAAGTSYSYKVIATTGDYGAGLPCAVVTHTVPASGTVTLDWDAVDQATGYNIYRLSGSTYYYLAETTAVTYDDDGSDTLSSTVMPTKATAVRQIKMTNTTSEKQRDSHWRYSEGETINRILWDGNVTLRLDVIPNESRLGFQVEVALTFASQPTSIPTILVPHVRLVRDFVRARVFAHPKTNEMPYEDKGMSDYHMGLYLAKRSKLKAKVLRGYGGIQRVSFPYFA